MSETNTLPIVPEGETADESGGTIDERDPSEQQERDDAVKDRS